MLNMQRSLFHMTYFTANMNTSQFVHFFARYQKFYRTSQK